MLLPGSACLRDCSANDRNGQNQYQQQQLNNGDEPNANARFRFHTVRPYTRGYKLERMAPNATTKIRGEYAEPESTSTGVDTGTNTKETKENTNTNEERENPGSNRHRPRRAQPAHLGGMIDNCPQFSNHFFSQHFRIFASSQTHSLEKFPGKSNFWSLVSQHDINNLKKYPSIFDMFTNSMDGTDFFRKILAFSTQLFGSFSNSLSSKEKEIFDIDSPREVIERLTREQIFSNGQLF